MTNEKRNWKQELKDAWNENKGKIKIGVTCLGLGAIYGLIKGYGMANASVNKLIDKIPYTPEYGDISEYIYSNLDKPEVIDEIRETIGEIDKL